MLSISVRLNISGTESPNVVIHGDDFVNDESSDKCVHAQ